MIGVISGGPSRPCSGPCPQLAVPRTPLRQRVHRHQRPVAPHDACSRSERTNATVRARNRKLHGAQQHSAQDRQRLLLLPVSCRARGGITARIQPSPPGAASSRGGTPYHTQGVLMEQWSKCEVQNSSRHQKQPNTRSISASRAPDCQINVIIEPPITTNSPPYRAFLRRQAHPGRFCHGCTRSYPNRRSRPRRPRHSVTVKAHVPATLPHRRHQRPMIRVDHLPPRGFAEKQRVLCAPVVRHENHVHAQLKTIPGKRATPRRLAPVQLAQLLRVLEQAAQMRFKRDNAVHHLEAPRRLHIDKPVVPACDAGSRR